MSKHMHRTCPSLVLEEEEVHPCVISSANKPPAAISCQHLVQNLATAKLVTGKCNSLVVLPNFVIENKKLVLPIILLFRELDRSHKLLCVFYIDRFVNVYECGTVKLMNL